ncbi:unnamed protein product [Musa hybrid cultivar]
MSSSNSLEEPLSEVGTSSTVASLDPIELKLLFGSDDDHNWDLPSGGSFISGMGRPSNKEFLQSRIIPKLWKVAFKFKYLQLVEPGLDKLFSCVKLVLFIAKFEEDLRAHPTPTPFLKDRIMRSNHLLESHIHIGNFLIYRGLQWETEELLSGNTISLCAPANSFDGSTAQIFQNETVAPTSMPELDWPLAFNRLAEKADDGSETMDDGLLIPESRRGLILTTQLMHHLIPAVPAKVFKGETTKAYESVTFSIAKSALADACSLSCSSESDSHLLMQHENM